MKHSKVSWRKYLAKTAHQVEDMGSNAEDSIEKLVFKRFEHLALVKRFVGLWIGLILLLIVGIIIQLIDLSGYYQTLKPVPGGIYKEGLLGSFTNANPIYANSDADNTLSSLIFAGLFKTDTTGNLAPNLASGYTVDATGKIYTVTLKPNLKWQDGKPLTSADVAFTFDTIENPDAQSPLFSSWNGIAVTATSPNTITFKLPDVLASFPYELTTGILPQHILGNVQVGDLVSSDFNTVHPVGSGPFQWQDLQVTNGNNPDQEQVQVALKPFANYNGGKPKLDEFILSAYASEKQLVSAFKNKDLTAMEAVDVPPKNVEDKKGVIKHSFILRAANMVFFKTSSGLLADKSVRQALVEGSNVNQIIGSLGYSTTAVTEPLLKGQLGYNSTYSQSGPNLAAAKQLLTSDGWIVGKNGYRYKAGQILTFTITASETSENKLVTNELQSQWHKLGLQLSTQLLDPSDYQIALSYHDYDALLAAITIGIDPDVFVYWDSSQADVRSASRLNFSEYSSSTADESLEAGRTRLDPALRAVKYATFLQDWQQDAPSLGLYQPRILYLTNTPVSGLGNFELTSATDRFINVQNWEIRQQKVTR